MARRTVRLSSLAVFRVRARKKSGAGLAANGAACLAFLRQECNKSAKWHTFASAWVKLVDMQLITQVWDSARGCYVEDELELWDALPSWQREALEMLSKAFPGSEWVTVPDEAYEGSETTQAVA